MKQAGFGSRVFNFLIDTLLIFGLSYAINTVWDFYAMYWGFIYEPFYVIFFGFIFFYYLFFESIFLRTPAKWITKCKVVNKQGKRPAFWKIIIRSAVRLIPIDSFFIPFLDKPLHDYLSLTEVVEV